MTSSEPGDEDCTGALAVLATGAELLGFPLNQEQRERFIRYCALISETSRHLNLTGLRSPGQIMQGLFLDSLTTLAALPDEVSEESRSLALIDVGSGAGIPGLALKIMRPAWHVTLVESIAKKARFLSTAVDELGLKDVEIIPERAEEIATRRVFRDSADLCTARAVAALPTLVELCAPLVRSGGFLALPKSGDVAAEERSAEVAMRALHVSPYRRWIAPESVGLGADRYVLLLRKESPTPSTFPRRMGLAKSRPLGS